jgi:hypothetical protein
MIASAAGGGDQLHGGNRVRKVLKKKAAVRRTHKGAAKAWSAAEVKMLRTMFKTTATPEIAKRLKRTLSSVRSKAVAMSLKKASRKKAVVKKAAPKRKVAVRKAAPMKKRGRRC